MIIFTLWLCDTVKCNPHHRFKSLQKSFHFELQPIPLKGFSVLFKKVKPFVGYEIKHSIKKRQAIQPHVVLPIPNELPVKEGGTLEDIIKVENNGVVDKAEDIPIEPNLTPQVIITSIIKPFEDSEPLPILLPEGSKLSADEKKIEDVKLPENFVHSESEVKVTEITSSSEKVVEITPKPKIEIVPPEIPPLENVVVSSPVVPVPRLSKIDLIRNPNRPILFTDITRIPLNGFYPSPAVGIPEFLIPSSPLLPVPLSPPPPPSPVPPVQPLPNPVSVPPPVIIPIPPPPPEKPPIVKEEIPVVREEAPNFLVKGSRFVLYFGSMMLQMLSQLVNGQINLSQPIDIPVLTAA